MASTFAQDNLYQKLGGRTNLKEVMQIVDEHFNYGKSESLTKHEGEREFENEYLHWKRWEYFHSIRLDEFGNITNNTQRLWEAYQFDARFTTERVDASYGTWTAIGPTGYTNTASGYNGGMGRVNCIAFHPTLSNVLFIGTPQGGVWKTTNGGTSWFPLTDNIPSTGVGGIVVSHADANTIYILTGDGDASQGGLVSSYGFCKPSIGVLKTTDGGVNWFKTGDFPGIAGNYFGYKLIQHPTNANTLFAATTLGIMKTTNGGNTWTNEQTGIFTDIEFKPGTPATMYAAQLNSADPFWKSTNTGDTWVNTAVGVPTNTNRIAIGVSANNSNYVYFVGGPNTGSGAFRGLYRSTDSGDNFTVRTTTPNILGYPNDGSDNQNQSGYDLAIAVDPDNVANVVTGGINVWKSTDQGGTFTYRTQWNEPTAAGEYVHADIHDLAYNPVGGLLYSCSDGGVGMSIDDGDNFNFVSSGLQIMAFYHADALASNNDFFAGGSQDNGTNYRTIAIPVYSHIFGADGFDCAIDQGNSNNVYYIANGQVRKTTNAGGNSSNISPVGVGFFPLLALDPNNSSIIYLGSDDVFKSTAGSGTTGGSWVNKGGIGNRVLTTCPSNSNVIYAGSSTQAMRSDNGGDTWAATISSSPGYPAGQTLTMIAVDPIDANYIWAVFGGYSAGNKVFRSTDAGANWTNVSGSLPNIPIFSVAMDLAGHTYIGTDLGVFMRRWGGADWQYFNNNLPKAPVTELLINEGAARLKAATFGRGLFEADLYTTCAADVFIGSVVQTGTHFFEASNNIFSTATVRGGEGTSVFYRGQNNVILNPGFVATEGSKFLAYNGPCGASGIPARVGNPDESAMRGIRLPIEENIRFPFGHFEVIEGNKFRVMYDRPGKFTLRIIDFKGKLIKTLPDLQINSKSVGQFNGDEHVNIKGRYYAQLFHEDRLVHFHEVTIH